MLGLLIGICLLLKCLSSFSFDNVNPNSFTAQQYTSVMRPMKLATLDEFSIHASDANDDDYNNTDAVSTINFNRRDSGIGNVGTRSIEMVEGNISKNKSEDKGEIKSENSEIEIEGKNRINEEKDKNKNNDENEFKNDLQEIHLNSPEFVIDDIPEKKNKESKKRLI